MPACRAGTLTEALGMPDCEDRILDYPFFLIQGRGCYFRRTIRKFANNSDSAIAQFDVRRIEIDHQVAHYFSEANHRDGRDHVQDELRRRSAF